MFKFKILKLCIHVHLYIAVDCDLNILINIVVNLIKSSGFYLHHMNYNIKIQSYLISVHY